MAVSGKHIMLVILAQPGGRCMPYCSASGALNICRNGPPISTSPCVLSVFCQCSQRGSLCTGLCAEEIHVCGEPAAIDFIRELMYTTGEEVEVMLIHTNQSHHLRVEILSRVEMASAPWTPAVIEMHDIVSSVSSPLVRTLSTSRASPLLPRSTRTSG